MRFFDPVDNHGNFVAHFASPDFGIWALAYTNAAQALTETLLERPRFPDYDGYPLAFLYRHALELHLKSAIAQSVDLSLLQGDEPTVHRLRITHKLPELYKLARRLLALRFPKDVFIGSLFDRLQVIVEDFNSIDPDSMAFRYPVDKTGNRPGSAITLSAKSLAGALDPVLEDLATIHYGMTYAIDQAQEAWQALYDAGL